MYLVVIQAMANARCYLRYNKCSIDQGFILAMIYSTEQHIKLVEYSFRSFNSVYMQ